jgi:amicyanin
MILLVRNILVIFFMTVLGYCIDTYACRSMNHVVRIKGMKFVPTKVYIKAGDTVTWVNLTASRHNVTFNRLKVKSHMLKRFGSYTAKFTKVGEYIYVCQPHQSMRMTGKIVVEE